MNPPEPSALSDWLNALQDYRVNPETAQRIGGAVGRFKKAEQALGGDTLFWTEPANMTTVLTALSPAAANNE